MRGLISRRFESISTWGALVSFFSRSRGMSLIFCRRVHGVTSWTPRRASWYGYSQGMPSRKLVILCAIRIRFKKTAGWFDRRSSSHQVEMSLRIRMILIWYSAAASLSSNQTASWIRTCTPPSLRTNLWRARHPSIASWVSKILPTRIQKRIQLIRVASPAIRATC